MSPKSIFFAFFATISIISLAQAQNPDRKPSGFTVDLIRREATISPSQRTVNALRRSLDRHKHMKASKSSEKPESEIATSPTGEFIMKYSIGTPPVATFGIADTGSDLTWTQCPPCVKCFKQNLPIFNPKNSSSYRRIPCKEPICRDIQVGLCSKSRGNCLFSDGYGDGSTTYGELARDTLALGSKQGKTESFPNFTFGCGFKNTGLFNPDESGIVGLGAGKYSLIGQLDPLIQGKFSYCLVSLNSETGNTSKIHFGARAVVSGPEAVSTPLLLNVKPYQGMPFYFLTLEGITIGQHRLGVGDEPGAKPNPKEGNIIIDSGTTLTFLPYRLYEKMENMVRSMIKLKQVRDPLKMLDLCYYTPKQDLKFPDMVVHFKGADVRLTTLNTFVMTSNVTTCLAFGPSADLPIYGNLAQQNFLVGYDVHKNTVSFKPTDCSKSS